MKKKILYVCFLFSISSVEADSREVCADVNLRSLLDCIENKSSEGIIANSAYEIADGYARSQGAIPNPELEIEHSQGNKNGVKETSASLLFDVNVFKISALGGEATARRDLAKIESELAVSQVRAGFIKGLRRIQYTSKLLELAKESQNTFGKILKQYASRPRLSPEQEASVDLFKLAERESAAQAIQLNREYGSIVFEFQQKYSVKLKPDLLKWDIKKWPEAPKVDRELSSPYVTAIKANTQLARSTYNSEKAASWPDLKLGPVIKIDQDNSETVNSVGLSLSTPLPLFNLNRGGRAAARKQMVIAELNERNDLGKVANDISLITSSYQESVAVLSKGLNEDVLKKNHERLEKMFMQGLIPVSLMIDAHQELYESQEKLSELEQEALDSLFKLQVHSKIKVGEGLI